MNKFVTFLLGMLFGIIFIFGALFGVGFYFYKKGNINMFTEEIEGLGDFNTMTVEEIIALIMSMAQDSQAKGSLGYLKATYNLDIDKLLDPEGLKDGLFDYFNELNIGYLMGGDVMGFLGTVKLGIGFAFAGDMVSPGGVALLREKSLGDILDGEDILSNLVSVFSGVRLGAFLGGDYSETKNDDDIYEYEYIGEGEGGLFALLANCELSAVLEIISGQSTIFEEIKVGGLSELGALAFSDLLSSTDFGELLEGKTLGGLIEEKDGEYSLQFMSLFNGIYIGKLLGYTQEGDDWTKGEGEAVTGIELALAGIDIGALLDDFSIDSIIDGLFLGDLMGYAKGDLTEDSCPEDCTDHDEGEHIVRYQWTNNGNPVSGIEAQLANFDLSALLNDFSVDALLGDMLLGDLMGYTKGDLTEDSCPEDCDNEEEGHEHIVKYQWTNNGNPVSGIEEQLANFDLADLLNDFSVDALLGDMLLGDIMGYEQDEDGAWVDTEGNPISGVEKALADTLMSDILEGFDVNEILGDVCLGDIMGYSLKEGVWMNGDTPLKGLEEALAKTLMSDILEGFDVNNILGDVYLGDIMGFTQGALTDDSCPEGCDNEEEGHEHTYKYKWGKPVEGGVDEEVKGIEFALANTLMSDILEGFDVDNILGDIYLGDVMGYFLDEEGVWLNNETDKTPLTGIEKALAGTKMSGILENFDVNDIFGEIYLGEIMGYERVYTCDSEEEEGHEHSEECSYIWKNSAKEEMSGLEGALADTLMSKILNGDFQFGEIIEEVYLGEVMGYTRDDEPIDPSKCPPDCDEDHEHEYYKYNWYKDEEKNEKVKGIEDALANTLMDSLLGRNLNINSIIGHLFLGEVMGYEQDEDGAWVDKEGNLLTGIEKALAKTVMNDILGGNFDVGNILGDVYLGEVMGHKRIYTCDYEEGEEHEHSEECPYFWADKDGKPLSGIEKALANTKMDNILEGFDIGSILGDVYLGEVMGFIQGAPTDDSCPEGCDNEEEGHEHIYKYKWGKPVEGGVDEEVKGIEFALANTLMSDVLSGDFNISKILGGMCLGEVMGYEQTAEGWKKDGTDIKGIELRLADVKMSKLLDEGLDINDLLGDMYLGEVMGFIQGAPTDDSCPEGCDNEEEGHEHIYKYKWGKPVEGGDDEEVKGIEFALANTLMSDVLSGDFNISKILGGMCLGEVMGYEQTEEGWKKDGTDIRGIELRLADVEMSKLLDEGLDINDLLGDMYLGEVMNYTVVFLDGDSEGHTHSMETCPYVWQKDGADVKGIEGRLANVQMITLLEGNLDMDEVIGSMYIGELMGYTQGDNTGGVCDPDCDTDHGASGHSYKEYEWWEDEDKTIPVDDKVTLIMCNMVMTQILNGDIDLKDKVLALTLKDLLDVEGNTILELLADTPINDLGDALNDLYIGELMGLTLVYSCTEEHDHDIDACAHWWLTEVTDISLYDDVAGHEEEVMSKGSDFIKIYDGDGLWYEAELEGETYIYKDVDSITKAMADTLVGGVGSISSRLTNAVSKASIGELIEMGVLDLEENYDTLDYLFCVTEYDTEPEKGIAHGSHSCATLENGEDRAAWWNLSLPDFLNALISKMAPY